MFVIACEYWMVLREHREATEIEFCMLLPTLSMKLKSTFECNNMLHIMQNSALHTITLCEHFLVFVLHFYVYKSATRSIGTIKCSQSKLFSRISL